MKATEGANVLIDVAMLGARMHYAVPRNLYAAGMLGRFFTDATATGGVARLLGSVPEMLRPAGVKRLLGRAPAGLPLERITAFQSFGWEYVWRRSRAHTGSEMTRVHIWAGRKFCQLVLDAGLGEAGGIYTFNSAGLELMEQAGRRAIFRIMEQTIAPAQTEARLLATEAETNPGWELPVAGNEALNEFTAREQEEWGHADVIVCGSDFVRNGIEECGGPVERCAVVPYGVDVPVNLLVKKRHEGPLRVLICGSVGLRKGAPYALVAAATLRGLAELRWCGSIGVLPVAARQLSEQIDLRGAVPRSQIAEHYAWADAFLLPSICEGSATVCYEALAAGLPVITTPNAGSVVRDGVDGFIVPIRDAEAIAEKIELLASDRELLGEMSSAALERSREFTLEQYGERLMQAIAAVFAQEAEGSVLPS